MIQGIIFDFDGVILESVDIKTQAFAKLFENYPKLLPAIIDYHEQNMGISRFVKFRYIYEHFLKQTLSTKEEKELGDRFESYIAQAISTVSFVPGALDFLKSHHKNFSFFVASGTPHRELINICAERKLTPFFKEVQGSPVEKQAIIADILRRYHWTADQVLFVGDAESDRKAAEFHRLKFIARIHGSNLSLRESRYQIRNLTELEEVIKKIQLVRMPCEKK